MLKSNPEVLFQKLGNEAVILHLKSEEYYGLDEVGTYFWEVLTNQAQGDIEQALPILLEEFDVAEQQLRTDLLELVEELKSENILIDA